MLHLTWDDRVFLYFNDQPVRDLGDQVTFRQRHLKLRLRRGDNRTLLKSSNSKGLNWGAWCFNARLVLATRETLVPHGLRSGIEFSWISGRSFALVLGLWLVWLLQPGRHRRNRWMLKPRFIGASIGGNDAALGYFRLLGSNHFDV